MSRLPKPNFMAQLAVTWNGDLWIPTLSDDEQGLPLHSGPGQTSADAAFRIAKRHLREHMEMEAKFAKRREPCQV